MINFTKYLIPIMKVWVTVPLLIRLKLFHRAEGWKYFFYDFGCLRCIKGTFFLKPGLWIERNSSLVLDGGVISIGARTFINRNCLIVSKTNITIGSDVLIADSVSIFDHDHSFSRSLIPFGKQGFKESNVIIHDNVWIGSHVVVLKGVTIGSGSVVAAGSVVTRTIPANEVWGGSPAKFLKKVS